MKECFWLQPPFLHCTGPFGIKTNSKSESTIMSVCLFVHVPGLLMPSALRTYYRAWAKLSVQCRRPPVVPAGFGQPQPASASPGRPSGLVGRNSSLESRWMGDATIPEVSTFVFMPNGPARCKKRGRNHKPSFTFQHFFKAFEMITIYIFML